jgi:hypothetical protein
LDIGHRYRAGRFLEAASPFCGAEAVELVEAVDIVEELEATEDSDDDELDR